MIKIMVKTNCIHRIYIINFSDNCEVQLFNYLSYIPMVQTYVHIYWQVFPFDLENCNFLDKNLSTLNKLVSRKLKYI